MIPLQEKAMDCLVIAALPIGSEERLSAISLAAKKWSWRGLGKKMEELVARGYIEPLRGGTAQGALTEKGREILSVRRKTAG